MNFALIGAAGYIAPRHMRAIQSVGGNLVAALDPHDNVGILDSYFPKCAFFTEFERFDRHLEKLKRRGEAIDYLVVCSPNYLHDAHCRFGLRLGAHVICEKPLVLNAWNVDALTEIEAEFGKKIYTILQLRLHPQVIALKKHIQDHPNQDFEVDLTYITSRGNWYFSSWKSVLEKSGGIATNIGIHFFDMLIWIFGKPIKKVLHLRQHDREAGYLQFEHAKVRWFLSISEATLPKEQQEKDIRTFRSLKIDGQEWEFSEGFSELHNQSYEGILNGEGFGAEASLEAIRTVQDLRNAEVSSNENTHDFTQLVQLKHPFLLDA